MRKIAIRATYRSVLQHSSKFWIGVLLALVVSIQPAWTQSNAVDGAVNGYVTDTSGGVVQNAAITLVNQDTNVSSSVKSGKDGFFRYPLVPVGVYSLKAKAPGYEEYVRRGVTVEVGSDVTISPKLVIGSADLSVNVNADASMLDIATPSIGGVITQTEIDNLPITSRNIYNLFFFVAGAKGIPSDNFATPGYSFGGLLRASWTLDGIDDADRATTSPLRLVIATPGAVSQIQVLSNGYQAEFGRTAGGQTSVITRGGTNRLHASVMYEYRPQGLAAIPSLGTTKLDLSWYVAQGNVGGPIIHDRLFYFINYEHNPYVQPEPNQITAANIAALKLTQSDIETVPTGQNYDSPSIRVDYRLNARNSGFLRYIRFTNNSPYSGAGALLTNSRSSHDFDDQNGGEAQLATTFSQNILNELRVGINRRETIGEAQYTPSPTDVDVNISGVADFGNSPSQSNTIESLSEIVDNITWQHGKHLIKAGGDYQLTRYFSKVADARVFTFSGLSAPHPTVSAINQYLDTAAGTIDSYTGLPYTYTTLSLGLGDPSASRDMHFFDAFVQDQYRVSRQVTATGGLRYEKQLYPQGVSDAIFTPDRNQLHSRSLSLAPRFAVSWQAASKTTLSAATGIYFDVPNLAFFTTLQSTDGNSYETYSIVGGDPGAPVFPSVPTSASAQFIPKPTTYTFDPNFRSMYAVHANARIQQVLGQNYMLTIAYMFLGSRFGPYVWDTNLTPTGKVLADGRPTYTTAPRPNANFGLMYQYTSGGTTSYNSIDVTLEKRMTHNLLFSVNYSYSHALGDSDQNGYVDSDPQDVHDDYGNLSTDVRNYFVGRGLYTTQTSGRWLHWANGIGLSATTLITSGRPLDERTTDLNGDGILNDRPLFVSRNAFRGPAYYRVDARASRTFTIKRKYRLEAIFESSNILNHENAACSVTGCNSAIEGTEGSTFGKILEASQSRTAQFGARFSF